MLIFQVSDAEINSFNELKNNRERHAVISTITSDDIFNRFNTEDVTNSITDIGTITTIKRNNTTDDASTYTWNEVSLNSYDVISKLVPNKTFKIKAKVKSITNFNPKIALI